MRQRDTYRGARPFGWLVNLTMTGSDGHTKRWTYNLNRKLATETIDGFKKTFSYSGNWLSSVAYHKNNAYICTEYYNRTGGSLTSVTMNTGDTIWTMRAQNSRLQPTKVGSGKLNTSLSYDLRGNVTERLTTCSGSNAAKQNFAYSYSIATGNMTSRFDWGTLLNETFGYDNMNRLTDITIYDNEWNCLSETETLYDGKGDILSSTDAGQYGYSTSLPYGMNALTSPGASIPLRDQYLHFNAMQLPDTISENGYTATFSYYGDQTRAAMTVTGPDGYQFGCSYYDQQYNEFSKTVGNATSGKSVLWLGGSPYSAPAALLKDYGQTGWKLVHVLRDNLGSITHVVDTAGTVLQELAYTAWGQLRDPQTAAVYGPDSQPELLLDRGYTGHEHLPCFGLINMNARLYDPAVGRFLSPDHIILAPDDTQNFNRYSYCLNNPLRYVDPFGLWYLSFSKSGQLDMVYLDEVVITGQRNNASRNISFMDGWVSMGGIAPYANLTWQYHVNNNQLTGNGENTFVGGGGRSSNDSAASPTFPLPQQKDTNRLKPIDFFSYSLSCISTLTKDSKTTFIFCKYSYEVKYSKKGYSKINGSKAYSVARLSKFLSRTGNVLSILSAKENFNKACDSFRRDDIEEGLEYGVDGWVDLICIPFGIYGVAFDLLWDHGHIKDAFWYTVHINQEYVIMPEYSSGVLGLPSTLPYK